MNRSMHALIALVMVVVAVWYAAPAPVYAASPSMENSATNCAQTYVVRRGDNLYRIARAHGTTVRTLQQLNGMSNPNRIYAGQRLCVRAGSQPGGGVWYTVQRGDTLTTIARRHNVRVSAIVGANNLRNPNRIYAGQRLFIPSTAAYNPGAAALGLNPSQGRTGTTVQITARGFPPRVPIVVGIGPEYSEFTEVARGTTDASGTFVTQTRVQGQAGTTWVVGAHSDARAGYPEVNVTARFRVTN